MATVASRLAFVSSRFSRSLFSYMRIHHRNCSCHKRTISTNESKNIDFGFLFDIDGVIVRGKKLLPTAREAFDYLIDKDGKFQVPVLFVTNAGNTLRQNKARELSNWLDLEIKPEQVVMSHSPLKMFRQFHDKHIMVSGQGPVMEIAHNLGFTNVTTVDTIRQCFPHLDMVDHRRRKTAPCAFEQYFPRIEAVILFGEPVRWETNLQLVLDMLLTNGQPSAALKEIPYPHLPVLACNMDLLWMAEACMPRFGHGCFLHSLESLYQKISGRELKYTALVGKPSELTYHHSDYLLDLQAQQLGMPSIKTIYCIGDNPESDIYGANLYNRYLQKKVRSKYTVQKRHAVGQQALTDLDDTDSDSEDFQLSKLDQVATHCADNCISILVCTGVYCSSRDYVTYGRKCVSSHNHRDFVLDPQLTQPKFVAQNVLDAVRLVFEKEKLL